MELTEGGSARALYGLWMCAAAVATIKGGKLPDDESELQVRTPRVWQRARARDRR